MVQSDKKSCASFFQRFVHPLPLEHGDSNRYFVVWIVFFRKGKHQGKVLLFLLN